MRKLMFFILSVVIGGLLAVSGSAQVMPPLCGCTKLLAGSPWPDGSPGTVPFGFPMPALFGVTNGATDTTTTSVCTATFNVGTQTWTCMVSGTMTYTPHWAPYPGNTGWWSPGQVAGWAGPGNFDTTIVNSKAQVLTTQCTGYLGSWIQLWYVPTGGSLQSTKRGDYWYCATQ